MEATKKDRRRSPFRSVEALEKDIIKFMNVHKITVAEHAKRISNYFEMCCFNYIVKYYEHRDYTVIAENLQQDKYRYKCSTQGYQDRFSNFKAYRTYKKEYYEFGIYHNLAIQSAYHPDIFLTPDISIIKYGGIKIDDEHYSLSKKLYYAPNDQLMSFAEAKQLPPFPELIFNFIGIVNELKTEIMKNKAVTLAPAHIAPSIMMSGQPNAHVLKIKAALEGRYCINVLCDLFASSYHPFSSKLIGKIRSIQETKVALTAADIFGERGEYLEYNEDSPF